MLEHVTKEHLVEQINSGSKCAADPDPDRWLPVGREPNEAAARRLCSGCPVIAECLELALRDEETRPSWGVYGATPASVRRAMIHRRQASRAAKVVGEVAA